MGEGGGFVWAYMSRPTGAVIEGRDKGVSMIFGSKNTQVFRVISWDHVQRPKWFIPRQLQTLGPLWLGL